MGRIRTIKPELFTHEELFDAEEETGLPIRLAFIGLLTQADREGRFPWKPRTLKAGVLPFDSIDFGRVLDALSTRGFVVRYASGGKEFGAFPTWKRHQHLNNRERPSDIPEPTEETITSRRVDHASTTRRPHALRGREGKGKELVSTNLLSTAPSPDPPGVSPEVGSKTTRRARRSYSETFDLFWDSWRSSQAHRNGAGPGSKAEAWRLWPGDDKFSGLLRAAEHYLQDVLASDSKTKHLVRFFRNDFWKEWVDREPRRTVDKQFSGSSAIDRFMRETLELAKEEKRDEGRRGESDGDETPGELLRDSSRVDP